MGRAGVLDATCRVCFFLDLEDYRHRSNIYTNPITSCCFSRGFSSTIFSRFVFGFELSADDHRHLEKLGNEPFPPGPLLSTLKRRSVPVKGSRAPGLSGIPGRDRDIPYSGLRHDSETT